MKKVINPITFIILATFIATSAMAFEGGNPRKGKHYFKKNCKVCHSEGAAGGNLTPMSKTQKQWDRFFDKDKHEDTPWGDISEQNLKDIHQFLFDHAADSPQPATCG
jgi:mono/diheme cytochrome c family protein